MHKYFLITNARLSKNGFILLYQDILKILNHDSRKYITNDKINALIEFKIDFEYFDWTSSLGFGKTYTSDSSKYFGLLSTKKCSSVL